MSCQMGNGQQRILAICKYAQNQEFHVELDRKFCYCNRLGADGSAKQIWDYKAHIHICIGVIILANSIADFRPNRSVTSIEFETITTHVNILVIKVVSRLINYNGLIPNVSGSILLITKGGDLM